MLLDWREKKNPVAQTVASRRAGALRTMRGSSKTSSVGFAHVAAQKLRTIKACTELMSKLKAKHKMLKASGDKAAAAGIAAEYKETKKQKQALENLRREHSSKRATAEAVAVAHGQRNSKVLQERLARRRAAAADKIAFHSQDHFVANLQKLTTVKQCDALLRKLKKKHKLLKGEGDQADAVALIASHYAACQDHRRALFAHPEFGLDDRIRALAAAGDAARERKGATALAAAKADVPSAASTRRDVAQYVRLQGTVSRLKALHAARKREGDEAGKKQAAKAYNAAIKQKKALKAKLAHVPRLKQLMGDATRQLADDAAAAAARKAEAEARAAAEAEAEEESSSSEEEEEAPPSATSDEEDAAAAAAAATRRAADARAASARPGATSGDSEEDPPPPASDSEDAGEASVSASVSASTPSPWSLRRRVTPVPSVTPAAAADAARATADAHFASAGFTAAAAASADARLASDGVAPAQGALDDADALLNAHLGEHRRSVEETKEHIALMRLPDGTQAGESALLRQMVREMVSVEVERTSPGRGGASANALAAHSAATHGDLRLIDMTELNRLDEARRQAWEQADALANLGDSRGTLRSIRIELQMQDSAAAARALRLAATREQLELIIEDLEAKRRRQERERFWQEKQHSAIDSALGLVGAAPDARSPQGLHSFMGAAAASMAATRVLPDLSPSAFLEVQSPDATGAASERVASGAAAVTPEFVEPTTGERRWHKIKRATELDDPRIGW